MKRLLVLGAALLLLAPAAAGAPRPLVLIAVVDSGITPSHQTYPELLAPGYNALDGSNHTADDFGHGDDVAAQLLQELSIGIFSTGICLECRVMPVKIAGESGLAPAAALASGLRWAADHGARVVNLSYGTLPFSPGAEAVDSALRYALDRGVVVVLSAGNGGSADPAVNKYASDQPDAIAVAAAATPETLEPHSNHGSWVDIAAIAGSTSLAAPQVAGAAAELISWRPELSRTEVERYLRDGCFPAPALDVAWHCLSSALDALAAAGFDPEQWAPVRVAAGGDGKGSIATTDSSIACTDTCGDRVRVGTHLTLTATPAAGSAFGGWSGDCGGRQPVCALTVAQYTDVTARFSQRRAALTVHRVGPGVVTSSPTGIRCGQQCSALLVLGRVTLAARAAKPSRFVRWEGACRGTRPVCALALAGPRTVIARFAQRP